MSAKPTGKPLAITKVPIDDHCIGSRWEATDLDLLARLVAIIAMGQDANNLLFREPIALHKSVLPEGRTLLHSGGKN